MTKQPKITRDTVTAALVLLGEWRPENGAFTPADFQGACDAAAQLETLQRQLRAIGVRQCNGYSDGRGGWDERAEDRDTARAERLQAKALEIAKPYGVGLKFGGDPRGSALRMLTPKSERHNTWGGAADGWAL